MSLYKEITKTIRRITKLTGVEKKCYITGSTSVENNHLYRVADLGQIAEKNGYTTTRELRSLYYPSCLHEQYTA